MSQPDRPRYPLEMAAQVAGALVDLLRPACARVQIAGSMRRGKQTVGDIEIVYVARLMEEPIDLITRGMVDQADKVIDLLLGGGVLVKRRNANGSPCWGVRNKLAVHRPSGIPVDLFSTTEECWFNYLVCRTGPAESNARIAMAARARGWVWNPYGPGFSRVVDGDTLAREHAVRSEEDVFQFVGLPYLPPEGRT
jgi:DNA polymerase/3'-5' exonuclease PolX